MSVQAVNKEGQRHAGLLWLLLSVPNTAAIVSCHSHASLFTGHCCLWIIVPCAGEVISHALKQWQNKKNGGKKNRGAAEMWAKAVCWVSSLQPYLKLLISSAADLIRGVSQWDFFYQEKLLTKEACSIHVNNNNKRKIGVNCLLALWNVRTF